MKSKDSQGEKNAHSFIRCDELILKSSGDYFKNSAVHDTLSGVGLIEDYRVYRKDGLDEISCVVKFGDKLNGHPGKNICMLNQSISQKLKN
jgi:hypothetical protein